MQDKPEAVLGLLPDFRAYEGAPVMLEEALSAVLGDARVRPLLRLHVPKAGAGAATVEFSTPAGAGIAMEGTDALHVFPWPYTTEAAAGANTRVEVLDSSEAETLRLRVVPTAGSLPEKHLSPPFSA